MGVVADAFKHPRGGIDRHICSRVTIGSLLPAASLSGASAERSKPSIDGPTAP